MLGQCGGESGIVDVVRKPDDLPVGRHSHRFGDGAEQGSIGFRIPEGMSRRIQRGNAAFRQQEAHLAFHQIEFLADPASHPPVLFRCGAHQRDLRIVRIEGAAAVMRRHRVRRTEIHHVERTDRADIGNPRADDRPEAVFGGRKNAAHHHVADLGRGDVDHTLHQAGIDELFHRPAADAGGVENQRLPILFDQLGDLLHARRRDAEHRHADERTLGGGAPARVWRVLFDPAARHRRHGMRTIAEHGAREAIESLDIRNGVHHRHVGRSDIGGDIARRHGRDHDLRHADRQRLHPGCRDRRAAGPTGGNDAGNVLLFADPGAERLCHRGHRRAAIAGGDAGGPQWRCERDFLRRNVGALVAAGGGKIDEPRAKPRSLDDVADVTQFLALGIERAGDDDMRLLRRARGKRRNIAHAPAVDRGKGGARNGARRSLDPRCGNVLRPARRQHGIGIVDPRRSQRHDLCGLGRGGGSRRIARFGFIACCAGRRPAVAAGGRDRPRASARR